MWGLAAVDALLSAPLWSTLLADAIFVDGRSGYEYTDPARFGANWAEEALLEGERSDVACACTDEHAATWVTMKDNLLGGLAVDPSMSGTWVHALCAKVHPDLFGLVRFDADGMLDARSECRAGLMAMAVVCAQSIALQAQSSSSWEWTERVVADEGDSVGDFEGSVALAQCLQHCEDNNACESVAYGPYGCHLKNKCVSPEDPLQPKELHSEGYRTYFRACRGISKGLTAFATVADLSGEAAPAHVEAATLHTAQTPPPLSRKDPRTEELVMLVELALQLSESAAHCFARHGWPFSANELIENHVELAEGPERFLWARAVRADDGAAMVPRPSGGRGTAAHKGQEITTSHGAIATAAAAGSDGSVGRVLERMRIRWARSLGSEVGFWTMLLSPPERNEVDANSREDARQARTWLETGEVRWAWDDLCGFVAEARAHAGSSTRMFGPARVLNAGSGPLAAGPLKCGNRGASEETIVPVISADGLARFYLKIFDDYDVEPPRTALQCPVESLRRCFPRNHFDVVHIRNALDHSVDPLLGISQMLEVVRPGGWVLLRHAQNEGVPGQFRVGLHQWAFDVANPGPAARFIVWNPSLRADTTTWLLSSGLASEVRTELKPHPGGGNLKEQYVWVDIQKPLPSKSQSGM